MPDQPHPDHPGPTRPPAPWVPASAVPGAGPDVQAGTRWRPDEGAPPAPPSSPAPPSTPAPTSSPGPAGTPGPHGAGRAPFAAPGAPPSSLPGAGLPAAPGAPGARPPVASGPPLAGAWPATSSPSPPLPSSGAVGGGGFGAPPAAGSPGRSPARRGPLLAALAVAAVFLAGAGGVVVGTAISDDPGSGPSATTTAVASRSVSTVPGPVSKDEAEPVAAVAAALSPAVVQIETTDGLGSGFIYDASGLIMTAAHVVDGASQVDVRLADGTRAKGRVLGEDTSTDVAVVKIEGRADLPVATLATGIDPVVGQTAIAIGSPFGLDQTVTAGIVSAVGRSTETPSGVIPAIQTDAAINSGNSGGALADRQGRVIGVNSSIITGGSQNTGNIGVGFAVPIEIAKAVADRIVAGESTEAGFLGVEGADASGERAGAAITRVETGSPAAQAGLTGDDVVVGVDGQQVSSMIDLAAAIRTNQPGEKVSLTVVRNGKERSVEVTLGTAPAN